MTSGAWCIGRCGVVHILRHGESLNESFAADILMPGMLVKGRIEECGGLVKCFHRPETRAIFDRNLVGMGLVFGSKRSICAGLYMFFSDGRPAQFLIEISLVWGWIPDLRGRFARVFICSFQMSDPRNGDQDRRVESQIERNLSEKGALLP